MTLGRVRQADRVVNYLMNLVENLPAVETDSALRSSWIPEEKGY